MQPAAPTPAARENEPQSRDHDARVRNARTLLPGIAYGLLVFGAAITLEAEFPAAAAIASGVGILVYARRFIDEMRLSPHGPHYAGGRER